VLANCLESELLLLVSLEKIRQLYFLMPGQGQVRLEVRQCVALQLQNLVEFRGLCPVHVTLDLVHSGNDMMCCVPEVGGNTVSMNM
jgi:hypothetical protein